MSKLVVTNIRLTKEELMEYRQTALSEEKSFSEFVRLALAEKVRRDTFGFRKKTWQEAPLWNITKYEKWSSGIKDGAKNHDKYIYSDPHKINVQ